MSSARLVGVSHCVLQSRGSSVTFQLGYQRRRSADWEPGLWSWAWTPGRSRPNHGPQLRHQLFPPVLGVRDRARRTADPPGVGKVRELLALVDVDDILQVDEAGR